MIEVRLSGEAAVTTVRCKDQGAIAREDAVAVEEPLGIFVDGAPCYLTMRSPGGERQLALGYCFSEGLIDSPRDVDVVTYCGDAFGNRVDVSLNPERKATKGLIIRERRLPAYSSCGICGKEMLEDTVQRVAYRESTLSITGCQIAEMLRALEQGQLFFEETGGTHAAAVFNRESELLAFAEDIGRHNALDKALGGVILDDRLRDVTTIALTSRLSYEMVQKVGRTRAEVLIGMSSPTSLGLELAKKINLTVVGFASQSRFNVYGGFERIAGTERERIVG